MKRLYPVIMTLVAIVLIGCAHPVTLTNFNTGESLNGEFNTGTREITVTMRNGEVLTGKYSAASNSSVTFGTVFAGSGGFAGGTAINSGGASQAYAILKSQSSSLMMELIVTYGSNNNGFGEARTNDGRVYKVQF
jgi:hypothetical protein